MSNPKFIILRNKKTKTLTLEMGKVTFHEDLYKKFKESNPNTAVSILGGGWWRTTTYKNNISVFLFFGTSSRYGNFCTEDLRTALINLWKSADDTLRDSIMFKSLILSNDHGSHATSHFDAEQTVKGLNCERIFCNEDLIKPAFDFILTKKCKIEFFEWLSDKNFDYCVSDESDDYDYIEKFAALPTIIKRNLYVEYFNDKGIYIPVISILSPFRNPKDPVDYSVWVSYWNYQTHNFVIVVPKYIIGQGLVDVSSEINWNRVSSIEPDITFSTDLYHLSWTDKNIPFFIGIRKADRIRNSILEKKNNNQ